MSKQRDMQTEIIKGGLQMLFDKKVLSDTWIEFYGNIQNDDILSFLVFLQQSFNLRIERLAKGIYKCYTLSYRTIHFMLSRAEFSANSFLILTEDRTHHGSVYIYSNHLYFSLADLDDWLDVAIGEGKLKKLIARSPTGSCRAWKLYDKGEEPEIDRELGNIKEEDDEDEEEDEEDDEEEEE